jgi:hypothetical protein
MVRIKHIMRPISEKAISETTNMVFEDVTEALSPEMEGSADAASSPGHEDSSANTGDSDGESRSASSDDTASESDSSKWAMVTVAAGTTFDFSASNVGKACVSAMEIHARYFAKGHGRSPGSETVPMPQANEAIVFKDLFFVVLCLLLHTVLAEI